MTIKDELHAMIDAEKLPEDCTKEEALYRLYVAEALRHRLETPEEEYLTHEQVKARFKRWLSK